MALVAKEKAVSEFVIGQMVLQNDPHNLDNLDAAREHFALSLASWEQAFRLWPYLVRENVRGDDPSDPTGHANLVGTGHAWRAQAQTHLARTTVR